MKIRENLKNTKGTDNVTWFDLAPYRNKTSFPDASMIESILEKAADLWKVIGITERKHSRYEDTSKNPEVNWLVLEVDREKFTELCHKYDIKGPDEEDEVESKKTGSSTISKDNLKQVDNGLQEVESITIITKVPGSRNEKLWLVFNNNFSNNVEFTIAGKRGGGSYIKTLFNLADGRGEEFSSQTATSINSKIFERSGVKEKYRQTTIVEKDGDKFRINKNVKISIRPMGMLNKEQLQFFPKI